MSTIEEQRTEESGDIDTALGWYAVERIEALLPPREEGARDYWTLSQRIDWGLSELEENVVRPEDALLLQRIRTLPDDAIQQALHLATSLAALQRDHKHALESVAERIEGDIAEYKRLVGKR